MAPVIFGGRLFGALPVRSLTKGPAFKPVLQFPSDFPEATRGRLTPDASHLLTGHSNGFVVEWDLKARRSKRLFEGTSSVRALTEAEDGSIFVGFHSGALAFVPGDRQAKAVELLPASGETRDRVWSCTALDSTHVLVGSTYGRLRLVSKKKGGWSSVEVVNPHPDSIFAISPIENGLVATADWGGRIIIWQWSEEKLTLLARTNAPACVEALCWAPQGGDLIAIDKTGTVSVYDPNTERTSWRAVLRTRLSETQGVSLGLADDGGTVYAACKGTIVQVDLESQQAATVGDNGFLQLWPREGSLFALDHGGLKIAERAAVPIQDDLIKYTYARVAVVGQTGVGKSTLCGAITAGTSEGIQSTFGRRSWTWKLAQDGTERDIVFVDFGGQEAVLDTLLPMAWDSDLVLLCFQKNDGESLQRGVRILDELEGALPFGAKVLLVETQVDQPVDDSDASVVSELIKTGKVAGHLRVTVREQATLEAFKNAVLSEINWEHPRVAIESPAVNALESTIGTLKQEGVPVILPKELRHQVDQRTDLPITAAHLRFLLRSFTDQGLLEYYPDIIDLVVLDDPAYNKARTDVAKIAKQKGGVVTIDELRKAVPTENRYVEILDRYYLDRGVAISVGDSLRIFPRLLRERLPEIPKANLEVLKSNASTHEFTLEAPLSRPDMLLHALVDIALSPVVLSEREGLLTWKGTTALYYRLSDRGDAIEGWTSVLTVKIGGVDPAIVTRMESRFAEEVAPLIGASPSEASGSQKKTTGVTRRFDVALSFAGPQRDFVRQTAVALKQEGLRVFFDEFEAARLWGKGLAQYLHWIYSSQAEKCIMFISRDYRDRAWPSHEAESALERHVAQHGGYLLPVRFDDTVIEGLPTDLAYRTVPPETPDSLTKLVLEAATAPG